MNPESKRYLDEYLSRLSAVERSQCTSFSAEYFCADEKAANLCAELIKKGKKTATCSLKAWYEITGQPAPQVGHLTVVTDWYGTPTSIIKTVNIYQKRLLDVSAEFAALEGEGDLSLQWWRQAHWRFFSKQCLELGIHPTQEMDLLLETFVGVYSK